MPGVVPCGNDDGLCDFRTCTWTSTASRALRRRTPGPPAREELCGRVERDEGSELVLLGDCFDFTAMQPPPKGLDRFFRSLDVPREVPPRRTLPRLLEAVRGSNPVAFEALAQLAKKAQVTVVPGNHDHHLGAPAAGGQLASAGIAARLEPSLDSRARRLEGGAAPRPRAGRGQREARRQRSGDDQRPLHQAVIPFLRHRGPPPNVPTSTRTA